MPLRTRPAAARDPLPLLADRATQELGDAHEAEARRRRVLPFSDGDGEYRRQLSVPAGVSRHPHRLGRMPRDVTIVGVGTTSEVSVFSFDKTEVILVNGAAFATTVSLWIS